MSVPARPEPVDRERLPDEVRAELSSDELPLYYGQPIRRAGGMGVWLILGVGLFYLPAAVGALNEIMRKSADAPKTVGLVVAAVLVGGSAVVFLFLSVLWIFWPLLSDQDRKRTHVIVSDERVLQVKLRKGKPPRVKQWPVSLCEAASVARRRGASATLILKERVRERRTDGHAVYEWDAIHGLPLADEALAALLWARHQAMENLHAAQTES